jgi:hypothetical protein
MLPTTATFDLLKPIGSYFSFTQQKHPPGKCIFQDQDFNLAFRVKYQ